MRALLLLAAFAAFAGSAGTVTSKNWEHHPSVEASRAVFKEVSTAVDGKTLALQERPDCTSEFATWFVATNGQGVVRYLRHEHGSDDSSHTEEEYYDVKGRLRFVHAKVGAVPDSWVEARF